MGARNVSAAFLMWPHLPHGAFRLLVGMALQSLDQPSKEGRPARVYYGGEAAMVEAFGRSRRSMYQALETLRKEGAVEVLDAGRLRHRAVYKLRLDATEAHSLGAGSRTQQGAESRTHMGAKTRTSRVQDLAPLGTTKEETKESREGNTSPDVTTSPAAAGPVDNPEIDAMDTGQRNQLLIQRHGPRVHTVLAEHAATHPDCDDPVRHLLATPTFRIIEGGKTA